MKQHDTTKYALAGLAFALFLGLTVWAIRNEGQRTRESLRDAAREGGGEIRKGLVEGAERVVDRAADVPGKIVRDVTSEAGHVSRTVVGGVKDILQGPAKADEKPPAPSAQERRPTPSPTTRTPVAVTQNGPQPKPAPQSPAPQPPTPPTPASPSSGPPSPTPQPPTPPIPASPSSASPSPAPPQPAPSAQSPTERNSGGRQPPQADPGNDAKPAADSKSARPADLIGQVFDMSHKISRAADGMGQKVLGLSWKEEQEIGREVHQMIGRDHKLARPSLVISRLERLAKPIIAQRTRTELTFDFYVIQSNEINAFAHAGGYVYVNTGLLKFVKSDEELQFILAHEIGHQELKHVLHRITYAARASQLGGPAAGTLANMAYMGIAIGYSKEQEFEADAWGFRAMFRAGRSHEEALAGMQHLLAWSNQQHAEPTQGEASNPLSKTFQQIENHFRSHPPTAERLRRLEAIRE